MTPSVAASQIAGHVPAQSPYEDVVFGQNLSITAGWLAVGRDPANVAPKANLFGAIRYDIGVGGPASLYVRYTASPSERNVFLPTEPAVSRLVATPSVLTQIIDGGLDISLTGKKSWHRTIPSIAAGVGLVSDFAEVDAGGYQFGTKFAFSYGFGLRYFARRGPQIRVDLTNYTWQYQFPDSFFAQASDTTAILQNTANRSVFKGNWGLSAGVTFPIFR